MSELLDQWTERMTRLERAENLRNLIYHVERLRDMIPAQYAADIDQNAYHGVPGLQYVQGVEGMIYELEQVR